SGGAKRFQGGEYAVNERLHSGKTLDLRRAVADEPAQILEELRQFFARGKIWSEKGVLPAQQITADTGFGIYHADQHPTQLCPHLVGMLDGCSGLARALL